MYFMSLLHLGYPVIRLTNQLTVFCQLTNQIAVSARIAWLVKGPVEVRERSGNLKRESWIEFVLKSAPSLTI